MNKEKNNPMKIAGCMPTKNYNDECQTFKTLKDMTDCVIVLDDNSEQFPFPPVYANQCDEYIQLHHKNPTWQDFGNRMTLFYRAFIHQCDWILMLDDDWILDASLNNREDLQRLITKGFGYDHITVRRRDLFQNDQGNFAYRSDGQWKWKEVCILYHNPFLKNGISFRDPQENRLHRRPGCSPIPAGIFVPEIEVYHMGCFDEQRRKERLLTYKIHEDPNGQFQADYDYMVDNEGMQLTKVPDDDASKLKSILKEANNGLG